MADEEMPLLHSRSGGRRGNNNGAVAAADTESPEPALKRQRQASAEQSCAAAAPLRGRAVDEALEGDRAVPAACVSGEPSEVAAPAGAGEGWNCAESGGRWWGLAREEPPPSPHQQQQLPRGQSQEEGAEAVPAGEPAEKAIGCGPAQSSNGAAEAERAPQTGPYTFVQQHLMIGTDPRAILKDLLPETIPPPELDNMTLWQIVVNILSEPPKRKKRKDINTIEDAVKLLQECKKIIVLTGAGVSVSCGIPDFRSRDGIYARLAVDFPDLPDPQAMFDIEYFRKDPRPFFKFAKEIYPGQFQPSLCHKFIALMDKERKLLRNYTQNIDTLEQVAGIQRIIQCHGSFATASCLICKYKVDCEVVRGDIFNQVVPRCPRCSPDEPLAIMKPEIVFFGENLPEQFHRAMKYDKDEVDLLIVIGSSLKVRPVALIPSSIPHDVPQILINREPLPHLHFDVELLGDCDVIINELCHRLGGEYSKLCSSSVQLSEITEKPPRPHREFEKHLTELPPTPLNISESSSSSDRIPSQDSQMIHSEHSGQYKAGNSDVALESKENSIEEKPLEVHNSLENSESTHGQLETTEHVKEPGSHQEENKERSEKTSVETVRKYCFNRCAKEQISKRLDVQKGRASPLSLKKESWRTLRARLLQLSAKRARWISVWSENDEQSTITSANRWMREMLRSESVDQVGSHYFLNLNTTSVTDRRAKALVVHRADIQAFAIALAPQLEISPEEFRAPQPWLDGFLQRYELSLRRSTTPFKLQDVELIKHALAFMSFVDGIDFAKHQLSNMIAMDETTVFMGQASQTTVDERGALSIYIPSVGYESTCVTCILAICLSGTKVPSPIITKDKKDAIERVSGIYVLETEKAWCTQAVIRKWVDLMLPLALRGGQRGTQYLFSPPNRYIFHGAEVYSDSEDDVISSSSCGSSSGSGSCLSRSLDVEEESELEDYYNGIEEEEEEEADTPDREEENGFEEDGTDLPESVDESVSINQTVEFDSSSDKL
ncbi:hypothetical protein Chor_013801 [Crotalus horridus]